MTPEELLQRLCEALGEAAGNRAWEIVDECFSGSRPYWPKRVRRQIQARTIYVLRSEGRSWTAVCASVKVSRATGARLYKAEMIRRRTMSQPLPKTEDEAA